MRLLAVLALAAAPVFAAESFTTESCSRRGGEVVNPAPGASAAAPCGPGKRSLGPVEGVRCPCVCCAAAPKAPKTQMRPRSR